MQKLLCTIAVAFLLAIASFQCMAEPARFALLIGNQGYTEAVGPLRNPKNDIALIKSALLKIGFPEANIVAMQDASRIAMLEAFDGFAARVSRAGPETISFFYYSGHGASNERHDNFLIPVDVPELYATGFWYRSVPLRDLADKLSAEAPNAKHFVIFDACRNTLRLRETDEKSLIQPKGFQALRDIPGGMLIAFATAEGELALDQGDSEGAGPYATALAEEIVKPGVEAITVFRNVQLKVSERIGQKPWTQNGPMGAVYFAGGDSSPSSGNNPQAQPLIEPSVKRSWQTDELIARLLQVLEQIRQSNKLSFLLIIALASASASIFYMKLGRGAKPPVQKPVSLGNYILTLGPPGSGKTTFQNLLLRFLDVGSDDFVVQPVSAPDSGAILSTWRDQWKKGFFDAATVKGNATHYAYRIIPAAGSRYTTPVEFSFLELSGKQLRDLMLKDEAEMSGETEDVSGSQQKKVNRLFIVLICDSTQLDQFDHDSFFVHFLRALEENLPEEKLHLLREKGRIMLLLSKTILLQRLASEMTRGAARNEAAFQNLLRSYLRQTSKEITTKWQTSLIIKSLYIGEVDEYEEGGVKTKRLMKPDYDDIKSIFDMIYFHFSKASRRPRLVWRAKKLTGGTTSS